MSTLDVHLAHLRAHEVDIGLDLPERGLGRVGGELLLLLLLLDRGLFDGLLFRRRRLARVALAIELANARHPLVFVLQIRRFDDQVQHVEHHLGRELGDLSE